MRKIWVPDAIYDNLPKASLVVGLPVITFASGLVAVAGGCVALYGAIVYHNRLKNKM